jgi:Flp pilus assembly protein TadB
MRARKPEREKFTLAERLAIGWRTTATGLRREFAAFLLLSIPIVLIVYAIGLPEWAGTATGLLAIRFGSAPLNRWLLGRIRLRRARRSESN